MSRFVLVEAHGCRAASLRQYSEEIVRRIAVVRNAQRFGFSLREIGSFLRVRERGGRPCETVRSAAQLKLEALDQHIADLKRARRLMAVTLGDWDRALAAAGPRPALLLERLTEST